MAPMPAPTPDHGMPAFLRAAWEWSRAPDDGARLDAVVHLLMERDRLYGRTHETADILLRETEEAERMTIAAGLSDLDDDTREVVGIISQGIAAQNMMTGEPLMYERKANTLIRDYLRAGVDKKFKDAATVTLDYIAGRHMTDNVMADRVIDTIRQTTGHVMRPRVFAPAPTLY